MNKIEKAKRFTINPVEFVIFTAVSAIFVGSVYNLFQERQTIQMVAARPAVTTTVVSSANLNIRCEDKENIGTSASKVRLSGSFCNSLGGRSIASEIPKPMRIEVTNLANRFTATVFTDSMSDKYSTDYIPLNPGVNPIHEEFTYPGSKPFTRNFSIIRH